MENLVPRIVIPAGVAVVAVIVLYAVRLIAFKVLRRWSERTETKLDDHIVATLKVPSLFWCLAISLYAGISVSTLSERYIHQLTNLINIIVVLSVTLAAANLAGRLLTYYVGRSNLPIPSTGIANGILKVTIIVIGFLVIMSMLGISITPMLTALGVGGLAVALALQDSLANLFSGLHILMEKPIRIGDFIRLETGQEGYVEDITWRTTRVRMLPNNMVVIPNSKLSQSIITNYYLPERRMSLLLSIGVSYAEDPEKIEAILIEEAKRAVGHVEGLLGDPEPFVRFIPGFGQRSLHFTLICQVKEFTDQYLAQHELRKRIFKRFREEGIEIPFPQRTVYLRKEKSRKP
jgi:small-conductance mechanosensitive channel